MAMPKRRKRLRNPNELTSLDAFLDEEGINEEVTLRARKRVLAMRVKREKLFKHSSNTRLHVVK